MAQINAHTNLYLNQNKTLFEVNMIANANNGQVVSLSNPFPVTGGNSFELNISSGMMAGMSSEFKNGYADNITQNVETTIWNESVIYPWSTLVAANTLYVSSTSTSDVGNVLRLEGLDSSYGKITEDVVLNGTSSVATVNKYLRINRGYLVGGNPNVGTVRERYANTSGTVVGSMAAGNSRNKSCVYTVPNGYTAYVLYGDATQFRGGAGNIGGQVRMYCRANQYSRPFTNEFTSEVVNGYYRNDFTIPLQLPQKTDIDVRCYADSTGTVFTCNYQLVLIAN